MDFARIGTHELWIRRPVRRSLDYRDHRCGLGVTSLFLTQRARVRSPVGSISWLRIFRGFPLSVKQISGNLGHVRPRLSYGHHKSSKPYVIRIRMATITGHSCSTWPPLNKQEQLDHRAVADGGFQIWGGHDVTRDCIICIYKTNTQIIILYSKISRYFYFENQSIHRTLFVVS